MKTIARLTLIVLSLTACSIFNIVDSLREPVNEVGQELTITGTVIENVQQVPADGNNFLVVDTEFGRFNVLYMEGGLVPVEEAGQQCNDNPIVAQSAQGIQVGDTVKILGAVHEFYALEVCSNTDFYITILVKGANPVQVTRTITGEVVELILDCAFDGICGYILETDLDEQVTVIWAEGMSPICQHDPFQGGDNNILVGDRIDTLGRVIDDNTISACGDPSYFVRKTG